MADGPCIGGRSVFLLPVNCVSALGLDGPCEGPCGGPW